MATTALEKARADLGLTQEEVAAAAGVNRSTIVRAEAGVPPARYSTRLRIARAVGRDPAELFQEDAA